MSARTSTHSVREVLDRVTDPEIPVLTIADLGILRDVIEHPDGEVEVVITPTYSGCPAMREIEDDVRSELQAAGYEQVTVTTVLYPAWTTDWMSEDGRRKLLEYGIAPPDRFGPKRAGAGHDRYARAGTRSALPALRRAGPGDLPVRLHRLQVHVCLQRLPRAVRLLQGHLRRPSINPWRAAIFAEPPPTCDPYPTSAMKHG